MTDYSIRQHPGSSGWEVYSDRNRSRVGRILPDEIEAEVALYHFKRFEVQTSADGSPLLEQVTV